MYKAHRYIKNKHVIIQKITMTTSVYKNMIYRKLIEDKHVKLRGTQMTPGATKETLRRENENLFFDVLCLTTFHWSFKNKN